MNKRLTELAEQCRTLYRDGNGQYVERFDEEKFAELIVKECAETVQDFVDHRFPASEYPERLKKYFGVEE